MTGSAASPTPARRAPRRLGFPIRLDEDEKARRADIVMQEQMLINDELIAKQIGRTLEVVVEGFDRYAECWYGRSEGEVPEIDGKIFFTAAVKPTVGEYLMVKITDIWTMTSWER